MPARPRQFRTRKQRGPAARGPRPIGDLNGDGTVDFADLLILAQNCGKSGADWSHVDLAYDRNVSFADLPALAQDVGQSAAPPAVNPAGRSAVKSRPSLVFSAPSAPRR